MLIVVIYDIIFAGLVFYVLEYQLICNRNILFLSVD